MPTFSTRTDALNYLIDTIAAGNNIGADEAEASYDIPAIAGQVIGDYPKYEISVDDPEGFWELVWGNMIGGEA